MPSTKSSFSSSAKPKFVLKRQRPDGDKSATEKKSNGKRARVEETETSTSKSSSHSESNGPKSILKTASKPDKGKGARHVKALTPTPIPKPFNSSSSKAKKPKSQISSASSTPAPLPPAFKLIAGSYEKLLYGLQGNITISRENPSSLHFSLKPLFIFPAHVSSLKAVAASPGPAGGKWLATGSTDEIIKVWDLRRQKEVGGLMHHNGKLSSKRLFLSFPHPR
jgi:protein MAK11